jgi:hypothetical protein
MHLSVSDGLFDGAVGPKVTMVLLSPLLLLAAVRFIVISIEASD